jgi:hypothetical protein
MPPEVVKRGWNRNNTWYHTDQSFARNEFECVQSWVTGLDVNEGDATLAFLEGSNQFHAEVASKFSKTDSADWAKLSKEEETYYVEKGCAYKKIKCPKGSMVFWDSRTIHCGSEAIKGRAKENLRAIAYLCYLPRSLCSKANIKKKQKAYNELRRTTHNPVKVKLFPKHPRTYGNPLPDIKPITEPILTKLGKYLAGF